MRNIPTNRGLIKTILIIVVALFILAYFGVNLRSMINSPTFQDNWNLVWGFVVNIWTTYLQAPATYLWNEIFVKLIWDPAIQNLGKAVVGTSTQQ